MNTAQLKQFCTEVRRDIINMTANAGSGHPGGSLSAVELMSAIFCTQMRIDPKHPKHPDRDRFVLSKGHAAPCYYGVLAELGFFDKDEFVNFRQLHSILQGHPDMKKIPGVDYIYLFLLLIIFFQNLNFFLLLLHYFHIRLLLLPPSFRQVRHLLQLHLPYFFR